ncbi:prosaposin-like isoform X1 [Mobula hypostoma]|uniref:prosaposin-like isoform X1 n=1 Tax=Mobula hypostoma TaxID=723540 RepID=UPI002FC301A4
MRSWKSRATHTKCWRNSAGVPQLKAADLGEAGHFQLHSRKQSYELQDFISCGICEKLVHHLRLAQKSISEVSELLEKGCSDLNGAQRNLCEKFVHSYKPELSGMLQKSQEEKDICGGLRICIRKRTESLLGKNKCTWGPSYFCKDRETATKCHVVEYCKNRDWN